MTRHCSRPPLASVLLAILFATPTFAAEPMVRVPLSGRTVDAMRLAGDSQKVFFLARDGQCLELASRAAKDLPQLVAPFQSYSQAETRGLLLREFGKGYEVSGVGHYLVVHPAGQKDQWAPRFESLYRSFAHYFAARGWQLAEPRFPLIAVVYPRKADFQQAAAKDGLPMSNSLLGYYSPVSNRILMYDVAAGRSGYDWTTSAETIVHEAAHQAAFNTGVHSRFGAMPRWVVEGLGTMFEARGVWQSRTYQQQSDRINRRLLTDYRQYVSSGSRPAGAIASLVSSDRFYETSPKHAYCEGWALSFFLCETQPKQYFRYLAKTAALPPFIEYRSPQRLKDFTDIFGSDLAMLDARMQRFIAGLK
ncbi:MAG: DUF1570 domain-containing protein [Planctomycetaceae bacterium]|nr:DUF1570 domain-containing protein [Planctomycetaceae bacterium]